VHEQIPTAESWKQAIASARALTSGSGEQQQQQLRKLVPIFVVGMPRSGSTLLEQMLAQVSGWAGRHKDGA